jgi:hypothetical protein
MKVYLDGQLVDEADAKVSVFDHGLLYGDGVDGAGVGGGGVVDGNFLQWAQGFDAANDYTAHDQPGELFDLSRDLAQRDNLYARQPEKVAELRALLEQVRAKGQVR